MSLLLFLHALAGLAVVGFGARLGRRALAIGVVPLVLTLVWLGTQLGGVLDGGVVTERFTWVAGLDLVVDWRLDAFAALMVVLVSGIGVLVFAYGARYFPASGEGLGRLIGVLTLFAGAMLGLVLADNLLILYACWELTSVTSYLLIGNDHTQSRARNAALQALLTTGAGGLAMLAGFVVIGQAAGTYQLSAIVADPPSGAAVATGLFLVLLGAFTKSAQVPFHSWLPGAMVAPTPVSAYLHSATMVKAGVYLVARLVPAFALVDGWRPVLVAVGLATMVLGGLRALRQHDLKLLLAFGTVSQLGFLMVLFGVGTAEAAVAGCALLLAHAAFKAGLFMVVGVIDHEAGTRDIRLLHRFGPGWRPLTVVGVVCAASMAGIPLTFGFIAKEAAYEAFAYDQVAWAWLVLAALVAGSALTVAYSARFVWGAFFSGDRSWAGVERGAPPPAPRPSFVAPAAVLAAGTVALGCFPGLADPLISGAERALDPAYPPAGLALWHGFTVPLVASAVTFVAGAVLFAARRPVARVLALGAHVPSAGGAYQWSLRALNVGADKVTGVVQSGSLPVYAGVILFTAAVLPGSALLLSGDWPGLPRVVDAPAQVPVAAVLLSAALAASVVRRRFSAALFLGTVGYAMAGLFVIQGAPDLALTQVAIETLSTVLFVLVLRRLPDRFEHRSPRLGRALRGGVAAAVGAVVFTFAIVAAGNRPAPDPGEASVSEEMVDMAVPDGGGENVVNVILVDFRGLDTLGEITVLAVAAIGAVALARAGRRPRPPVRRGTRLPGRPPDHLPESARAAGSGPEPPVPAAPEVVR